MRDLNVRSRNTPPLPAMATEAVDEAPHGVELPSDEPLEMVEPTRARFLQLALFSAACFMCAQDWNVLAPVYSVAQQRFDVSLQRVNSLSNAWNIYAAPGAVLALWLMERTGLRVSLLTGFASQLVCSLLAHAACVLPWPPRSAFQVLYASQALGALGQSCIINNVTRLAGDWFPSAERDAAVAVSLLFVAGGSVFMSLLAPALVALPSHVDRLFLWQVPVWGLLFSAALFLTADAPPLPPSVAAAAQRRAARAAARAARAAALSSAFPSSSTPSTSATLSAATASAVTGSDNLSAARLAWDHAATLLRSPNFLALTLSYSILTGLCYLVATVVGQLVVPCGGSPSTAGAALAALAASSVVGVVAYLAILRLADGTGPHPYVSHQQWWSGLAALGLLLVLSVATKAGGKAPWLTVSAWAALGCLSGTLLNGALTMEHAAELSFPLPANVSVALLGVASSLVSFIQVVAGTALLQLRLSARCEGAATPFAAFVGISAAAGVGLLAFLKPEYRRAEVEAHAAAAAGAAVKGGGEGGGGYGAFAS